MDTYTTILEAATSDSELQARLLIQSVRGDLVWVETDEDVRQVSIYGAYTKLFASAPMLVVSYRDIASGTRLETEITEFAQMVENA